ncbi:MAG: 4Fe-4S binding protein [Desulfovibrionaceae bacterium]
MAGRLAAALAFALLAAHAMRVGAYGGVAFWLLAGGLAMGRAAWARLAAAGLLAFGMFFWFDLGWRLAQVRMAFGQDWWRLGGIMGAVALATATASVWLARDGLARRNSGDAARAAAFLLTVGGLALATVKTPLTVLMADRFLPGAGWVEVFGLGVYAAWATGAMRDPVRAPLIRRRIWSVFTLVFFGQLVLGLAGAERFLMTGTLHLPVPALIIAGPLFRGDGYFMLILFAATVVLVGPAWCSHLCYIGVWDNWGAMAKARPKRFPRWRAGVRWAIALLVFGTAVGLRKAGVSMGVAVWLAAAFGLGGVALMATWSRRMGAMTHCAMYCPMGLLASLCGRLHPWRMRMLSGCTQCGKCALVCRYGALTKADIERGRPGMSCTLCGDCVAGCPHGQLAYAFPGLSAATARTVFIVLVVALHAVFLGVARI